MKQNCIPSPETLTGNVVEKPVPGGKFRHTPDVTVVTVCFNPIEAGREELFKRNLDSVQRQRDVTVEHLIVDGASTDGTQAFVMHYGNDWHTLRLLSKADSGIYEAMNRGIALARGKYVAFLNSDDHYHRDDGLAASVMALEESGACFSFAPILARKKHGISLRNPKNRLHKFFVFCVTRHPSMLFRRDDLMEMGGYDEAYRVAADYDLMLRLVASGRKACYVGCSFATFVEGGFAMQNEELKQKEKKEIIRNVHREAFGVELLDAEAAYITGRCTYPRRLLSVYIATQEVVRKSFVGLPQDFFDRLLRRLNYWKYYLKCRLS